MMTDGWVHLWKNLLWLLIITLWLTSLSPTSTVTLFILMCGLFSYHPHMTFQIPKQTKCRPFIFPYNKIYRGNFIRFNTIRKMCRWRYSGWENVGSLAFNHQSLSCCSIIHHLWKSCTTRWDHLYIYSLCYSASQTLSFPILQKLHARQSRLNIALNASNLVVSFTLSLLTVWTGNHNRWFPVRFTHL